MQGNIVPYTSKFSVLETLVPYNGPTTAPSLSHLELALTDTMVNISGTRKAKKPPQLLLDTSFVPFVNGSLIFSIGDVTMVGASASRFQNLGSRTGAIRYVLGPNTYTFSPSIGLDPPTSVTSTTVNIANIDLFGASDGAQTFPSNKTVALPVNTLMETSYGGECSFEVQVYLLDIDSGDANFGSEYCIGVGVIQTAPLYYLALRNAASSSMPPNGSSTHVHAKHIGASPWLMSRVNIIDPLINQVVAVARISTMFMLESVVSPVCKLLQTATGLPKDQDSKARIELGLKQTFLVADVDKSGNVSRDEVSTILQ